eukprot:TRINITY_DN4898_c1_g1_i7.p1 TRINITY_DN4898_c1_g1~~TRINITY_DN4898_c1_g1_i7.p1  ORF type:complete len:209 (-),score=-5.32 TRINITY_DN4898_c1_g1_i7:605-1231(-)
MRLQGRLTVNLRASWRKMNRIQRKRINLGSLRLLFDPCILMITVIDISRNITCLFILTKTACQKIFQYNIITCKIVSNIILCIEYLQYFNRNQRLIQLHMKYVADVTSRVLEGGCILFFIRIGLKGNFLGFFVVIHSRFKLRSQCAYFSYPFFVKFFFQVNTGTVAEIPVAQFRMQKKYCYNKDLLKTFFVRSMQNLDFCFQRAKEFF